MNKAALERRLSAVEGFADPTIEFEQYSTPADLAAHLVHLAAVQGDVAGKTVLDLGTGTGMLALGAACRDPLRVLALDRDPAALRQARANEDRVAPPAPVSWLLADATRHPLCPSASASEASESLDEVSDASDVTILMNPPFGAQRGNAHADRAFLETAAEVASVSYSIHNAGSQAFVEAFSDDVGGDVTHAFRAKFALPRQYDHQTSEREVLDAEVFRIEWE